MKKEKTMTPKIFFLAFAAIIAFGIMESTKASAPEVKERAEIRKKLARIDVRKAEVAKKQARLEAEHKKVIEAAEKAGIKFGMEGVPSPDVPVGDVEPIKLP